MSTASALIVRALSWYDGYPDFGVYRTLLRQESLSPDALRELRRDKTRRLVQECLDHVPYYGDLMRQAGIRAESVEGPEDLEVLPLLDKTIIRKEGDRLLNQAARASEYRPHTTSGSTGAPLDFYRGFSYDLVANAAGNWRALHRMGASPGDRIARFWSPPHLPDTRTLYEKTRRMLRGWVDGSEQVFNAYETSPADMERWLPRLRRFRPRYLYGYTTILKLFTGFLSGRGERIEGVRGIACTAEALFPEDRTRMKEVFPGAVIIDIYGSREIPGIASECARGTMHVSSDLVHVEHLPAPGEPDRRRLVVTALDNTIFPFIRYDIGDYGSPKPDGCSCGLPFPAMLWGPGKILDTFVSPEGRLKYGGWFEGLMYNVRGVHAYQFRQKAEKEIVLFVVPARDFDASTERHLEGVAETIRGEFSPLVTLRVEKVGSIPLTRSGKHRFVVSEVRNPLLSRSGQLEV